MFSVCWIEQNRIFIVEDTTKEMKQKTPENLTIQPIFSSICENTPRVFKQANTWKKQKSVNVKLSVILSFMYLTGVQINQIIFYTVAEFMHLTFPVYLCTISRFV